MIFRMQIIVTAAQFAAFLEQHVRLRGVYQRLPAPVFDIASSGTGVFKANSRPYARARLRLEADGHAVAINSPLLKTSLRSPDELERFDGQLVELIGVIGVLASDQQPFVQLEGDVIEVSV